MKKFILSLFIILVLLVGIFLYVVARSLDADAYQQQIINSVSELTGRKMTVSGNTTLKWLPMPTLVMTGISVSNHQGSDKQSMLTADSLKIEIEWNSLFKTPLVIKNVELNKPVLYLERLESNRANWIMPFLSAPDANINDNQLLSDTTGISNTQIDRLHIAGGTIVYDNQITGQQAKIQNINGDLSVSSPKGPYKFNGSGHFGKNILSGTIDAAKIHNDMPSKITFNVHEKNSALSIDFTGEIEPNNPKKIIQGDASFSLGKPAVLFETLGVPVLVDTLKQKAVGSFAVDITPLNDKLDNLIVRFGDGDKAFALTTTVTYQAATPTNGASYTGELAVNKLDYETFKPYFELLNWSLLTKNETKIPDIQVKINIPELVINNQSVKAMEGALTYKNHQLEIQNGKANLPGNMPVTFRIDTGMQNETPYMLIHARGKTKEVKPLFSVLGLQSFIEQQEGSTKPQPAAMIKDLDADVRLTWAPNFMSLLFNSLKFDATDMTGTIDFATSDEKKLAVDLTVNNLNTDTYTGWVEPAEKTPLAELPALLEKRAAEATFLSGLDFAFRTKFNALTWHNLPITSGMMNGSLKNGQLNLVEAEFTGVATTALKTSAVVSNIGTPNANIDSASFSLTAAQLPLFLGRAGLTSSLPLIMKAAETKAAGSVTGSGGDWKTNILVQLNDASMKFNGGLSRVNDEVRFEDFNFNIIHPNFQKFLQAVNINPQPVRNLTGALRAQGTLNGSDTDLTLTNGDVFVGIQRLNGTVEYANNGTKKLVINAASPALEGERFIPKNNLIITETGQLSQTPFDFKKFDEWDITLNLDAGRLTYKALDLNNAKLKASMKDKVFTLSELSGIQRGNSEAKFNASGTLSYVGDASLKAAVEVSDVAVRPDFMIVNKFSFGGGKMAMKGNFEAVGNSPAAMVSNLSGNGSATFDGGQFIGVDLAKATALIQQSTAENMPQETFDSQMNRLMSLGKTPVTSLSGAFSIAKGVVRFMDMVLKTPTAVASPTQIVWNIPQSALEISMPFTLNAFTQYPPIILGVVMDSQGNSYSADYSDLSDTLAGIVKKEITSQQTAQKEAEAAAAAEAEQSRQETLNQMIEQANTVVRQTIKDLQGVSNDQAAVLLQNAGDALSIVNQLAIKEEKTQEQENMILEQARLAVMKANEAKEAAKNETMDYRKTIDSFETQGAAMLNKMVDMQQALPHIVIIPKLIEQTRQNLNLIHSARTRLAGKNDTGAAAAMTEAAQAYEAIETAYANVMRFDTQTTAGTVALPSGENKVRGTITRR